MKRFPKHHEISFIEILALPLVAASSYIEEETFKFHMRFYGLFNPGENLKPLNLYRKTMIFERFRALTAGCLNDRKGRLFSTVFYHTRVGFCKELTTPMPQSRL